MTERTSARDIAFFVALTATAFALGPALAHALELPGKIGMTVGEYFTVQRIYKGWNQIAYVLALQAAGILGVMALYWRVPAVRWSAMVALVALVAAQVLFWMLTYPANQATADWTQRVENREALRAQWEYSHLAGAASQSIAMTSLVIGVLRR